MECYRPVGVRWILYPDAVPTIFEMGRYYNRIKSSRFTRGIFLLPLIIACELTVGCQNLNFLSKVIDINIYSNF